MMISTDNYPMAPTAKPMNDDLYSLPTNSGKFQDMLKSMAGNEKPKDHGEQLEEAGKQMETQYTLFMLKAMEKGSTENGFLGSASQGMGYFKDLFLENIAKEVSAHGGLGFGKALRNAHESKALGS